MSEEKTSNVSEPGSEAERVYDEPLTMTPEKKPIEAWNSRSKRNLTKKSTSLLSTTFILNCLAIPIAVIALCVAISALIRCNGSHEPTSMSRDSSFQDLQRQLDKTIERLALVERENAMLKQNVNSIETHPHLNRFVELEDRVATLEGYINTTIKNKSYICTQPEYRINFTSIVENHTAALFGNLSQIEDELAMLHVQVSEVTAAVELLAASHNTTMNSLLAIHQGILDLPMSIAALNATLTELSTTKASQKDFDHLYFSFKNLSTTVGILNVTTVRHDDIRSLSSSVHDLAITKVSHTEFSALFTNFSNLVSDFTVFSSATQNEFHNFSSVVGTIDAKVQQLYTTTVNKTDFRMLTADLHSIAANSVNLTEFNILSANVSSVDAETKRLAANKASQDDFNRLFSLMNILNMTKASQAELDSLSSNVSLMRVTLQQLSTSAVNKTQFHQLTVTVSFNISMINETLQHLKATTVNRTDFQQLLDKVSVLHSSKANDTDLSHLSDDLHSLAANSVNLTDFNILSANVSSLDAETKRLAANKASQDDFNLLFSSVNVLNLTKASQAELDSLSFNVSLMRVTLQQLSTSAVNKIEFHQLTTTVSFNVSMINETLQHLKDTTVNQTVFQQLSDKVTVLQSSKANDVDLSLLSEEVSLLTSTSVKISEFDHYKNQLQSLNESAVSKFEFTQLSTHVNILTTTSISRTEFSRLSTRVNAIEATVSKNSTPQTLANPIVALLIPLLVSYLVFWI